MACTQPQRSIGQDMALALAFGLAGLGPCRGILRRVASPGTAGASASELAHMARPVAAAEHAHRRRAELNGAGVLAALAQQRQLDAHHVDTVVQVNHLAGPVFQAKAHDHAMHGDFAPSFVVPPERAVRKVDANALRQQPVPKYTSLFALGDAVG